MEVLLLVTLMLCAWLVTSAQAEKPPNFVVFFVDDWGWGDLGANWNKSETPYMDKLTATGMRFTDFHAGASVCTPSRAALLTGRLGLRTGITHNFGPSSIGGLPRNETIIAEMLKPLGYRTAMLGKWHLGTTKGFHPFYRGFDETFIVPYSLDMGCTDQCGAKTLQMPLNLPQEARCPYDNASSSSEAFKTALPLYRQDTIIDDPTDLCELADRYVSFAEEFIRAPQQEPFFLYAALSQVHVPHAHAPRFTTGDGSNMFHDTLLEADATVGRIVTALEEAGVRENTLIVLTGDNGPWEAKCDLAGSHGPYEGLWQKNEGGGGSSSKMTSWEGGHREVGVFSWPAKIKAGTVSHSLASTLDLLPTFAKLSGAPLPPHRQFDGVDISNVLFSDGSEPSHRKGLFHPNSGDHPPAGGLDAVRYGDYKAFYKTGGTAACGGHKGPVQTHSPPLLFNLREDPAESKALDSTQYANIIQEIDNALKAQMENIARDNTTVADYREAEWATPCCDHQHVACRCNH